MGIDSNRQLRQSAERIIDSIVIYLRARGWLPEGQTYGSWRPTAAVAPVAGLILEIREHFPNPADPDDFYRVALSLNAPWGKKVFASLSCLQKADWTVEHFSIWLKLEALPELSEQSDDKRYRITNPDGIFMRPRPLIQA